MVKVPPTSSFYKVVRCTIERDNDRFRIITTTIADDRNAYCVASEWHEIPHGADLENSTAETRSGYLQINLSNGMYVHTYINENINDVSNEIKLESQPVTVTYRDITPTYSDEEYDRYCPPGLSYDPNTRRCEPDYEVEPSFGRDYACEFAPPARPLPKIEYPKDLECVGCGGHIDQPQNLVEFLGPKEAKNYLDYCKQVDQAPQIYCCSCFSFVKKSPQLINAHEMMLKEIERLYKVHKKEKELEKREAELDKQLVEMKNG